MIYCENNSCDGSQKNMFYALACKIVAGTNKGVVFGALHIEFPVLYLIDLSVAEDILKPSDLNDFSI